MNREFAHVINLDTLPSWRQFARLLFSPGSEVVAIGVPRVKIGDNPYQYTAWWLPVELEFVFDGGEEIRNIKPEYEYYFQHVHIWLFHATSLFKRDAGTENYLQTVDPGARSIEVALDPIAMTRFEKPVAFRLILKVIGVEGDFTGSRVTTLAQAGEVVWLPPTTELTHYEAVNLILRERYGLCLEQAPPDWVEPYKLPNQLPIEGEMAQVKQKIDGLTTRLTEAQQRLNEISRFQKLLYEQGEDALEPVVRDALRELGAEVQDPERPGREDGRLVAPTGQNGMLEIKGRTNPIRLRDVRQLDQWVRDAVAEENWENKGLLIANTFCGDPIGQRGAPFPDNCIQTAERFEQCLITTTQLFRALCSHQRGELDVEAFWNTVFDTNGVCPLPELEPLAGH